MTKVELRAWQGADPEAMYTEHCLQRGQKVDRCKNKKMSTFFQKR